MSVYADHDFNLGSQNNSWAHLYDFIPESARVLDVGCSTAAFDKVLVENKSCTVVGIDLDKGDIAEARKNISEAHVMDINSSETKKLGKFDVVIFADVLEHLFDPRVTLQKVKAELLNPGGRVCFSIPHMAHISVRLELLAGKFTYGDRGLLDRTHLHFYDQAEVESVFAEAGYRLTQLNPTISSYPKELITLKLGEIGLEVSDKFLEFLERSNSSIFQFIGYAEPTDKSTSSHVAPTFVMPQDEILAYAKTILTENDRLWAESQKIHQENLRMASHIEQIKRRPVKFISGHLRQKIKKRLGGHHEK